MANYNRTLGFGSFPTRGGIIDRIPYSAAFDGASGYLSKDFGSAGNRRTLTWSFWIKSADLGAGSETAIQVYGDDQNGYPSHRVSCHAGRWFCYSADDAPQNNKVEIYSENRYFRDHTSWTHIVFALDTTQATAADRLKVYVNGTNETTRWTQTIGGGQNFDTHHNSGVEAEYIGRYHTGSYLNGNLAHYHFIDGTAYDASYFGETDTKTGEWLPITEPSVTYGSKGFFLDFADSSALGNDVSGNNNDWTVNGNIDQSISRPHNNFCIMDHNQANVPDVKPTFSGTGVVTFAGAAWTTMGTTYAMLKGKWYVEMKVIGGTYRGIGFYRYGGNFAADLPCKNTYAGDFPEGYFYKADQKILANDANETTVSSFPSVSDNDIIMFALDLDNGKAYYGVNGTWNNSGSGTAVPASGTNAHHTFTVGNGNYWGLTAGGHTGATVHLNFGEGRFGTTALSSAVDDNNGHGTFEYTPPAGYYSICTRNIREYG